MNCRQIEELLPLLVDEDGLDEQERGSVLAHVEGCSLCQEERRLLHETVAALSYLEDLEPPPQLRANVRSRVERLERWRFAGILRRLRGLLTPRPLLALAAATASLFLVVTSMQLFLVADRAPSVDDLSRWSPAPAASSVEPPAPPPLPLEAATALSSAVASLPPQEPLEGAKQRPAAPEPAPSPVRLAGLQPTMPAPQAPRRVAAGRQDAKELEADKLEDQRLQQFEPAEAAASARSVPLPSGTGAKSASEPEPVLLADLGSSDSGPPAKDSPAAAQDQDEHPRFDTEAPAEELTETSSRELRKEQPRDLDYLSGPGAFKPNQGMPVAPPPQAGESGGILASTARPERWVRFELPEPLDLKKAGGLRGREKKKSKDEASAVAAKQDLPEDLVKELAALDPGSAARAEAWVDIGVDAAGAPRSLRWSSRLPRALQASLTAIAARRGLGSGPLPQPMEPPPASKNARADKD